MEIRKKCVERVHDTQRAKYFNAFILGIFRKFMILPCS